MTATAERYRALPGETDRVVRGCVEHLVEVFRHRPWRGKKWGAVAWHLTTTYFTRALAEIRRRFEPLEIKGDAEVHALSRCQMTLTEAKKRAQREYGEALARTG